MDGLPTCPTCGGARTGSLWGKPVCLRCRGDRIRLGNAAQAVAKGRAAQTAAKIAHETTTGTVVPDEPMPARTDPSGLVVVVARAEPAAAVALAPSTAVPTLRQRLKARRLAERAGKEA